MTEPAPLTCDRCGGVGGLFARVDYRLLCLDCWNRAGRPFPESFRRKND